MGYFKDWQKRRRIREALNRLPGDQEPRAYITNTSQDVARMEQQADLKELEAALQAIQKASEILVCMTIPGYPEIDPSIYDYIKANPQLRKLLGEVKRNVGVVSRYLVNRRETFGQMRLSQGMRRPPSSEPPPAN